MVGVAVNVAGLLGWLVGMSWARNYNAYAVVQPLWLHILVAVAIIVVSTAGIAAGVRLAWLGRKHTSRVLLSIEDVVSRPFVLYLRPFVADDTLGAVRGIVRAGSVLRPPDIGVLSPEEALERIFRRFGRLVAVGRPSEAIPLPGAQRAYLPLDDWRGTVGFLMVRARVVLLVTGMGAGTLWEFGEAMRTVAPTRLVLLVTLEPEGYAEFRSTAMACLPREHPVFDARRGNSPQGLPDYPELARPEAHRVGLVVRGVIHFHADWSAHFMRSDDTSTRWRRLSRNAAFRGMTRDIRGVCREIGPVVSGRMAA